MERSWKIRSLTHLLDSMEIAHKNDIALYTSGHLNHNKLYKPSEKIKRGQWDSSKKQTSFMRERDQFLTQTESAKKMSEFSSNFYSCIPPLPTHTDSSFPTKRYPQSPVTRVGSPADVSSTPLESLDMKETKKKVEEGTERLSTRLKRHELDVPEIMVLKNKPVKNSQLCVAEPAKEEYQFIPSYMADITKTQQFNKFLHYQREFIANQELLQNDFTGSKISEQHEMKLTKAASCSPGDDLLKSIDRLIRPYDCKHVSKTLHKKDKPKELQKICDCDPCHFKRLQVVEKVFEDICNSTLIFGDILKKIKNGYEQYMMMLLDSLPTEQFKILKAQAKGMKARPSKAQEIETVRKDVQVLKKKAKNALKRNQQLQNGLERLMWMSQTPVRKTESCSDHETKKVVEKASSIAEQLESLRCKVLSTWEEMMILETEKKERMACAEVVNMANTVKDVETEITKIDSSNNFLQCQIKDVEDRITETLDKLHISQENQKKLWESIEEFLLAEEEQASENAKENKGDEM